MDDPLIVKDPNILGGIPVFYGTRVPIKNLVDYLSTGETIDTFLKDFPSVRREQVVQFLDLSGELRVNESVQSIPTRQGEPLTKIIQHARSLGFSTEDLSEINAFIEDTFERITGDELNGSTLR